MSQVWQKLYSLFHSEGSSEESCILNDDGNWTGNDAYIFGDVTPVTIEDTIVSGKEVVSLFHLPPPSRHSDRTSCASHQAQDR